MKSEDEPITDDEFLLRRVHRDRFPSEKVPFVSPNAFEPRIKGQDIDSDGISLYREACLEKADEILADVSEQKRRDAGIVKVSVAFIRSLGMTVKPSPTGIKGHVVLPELNAAEYKTDKVRF